MDRQQQQQYYQYLQQVQQYQQQVQQYQQLQQQQQHQYYYEQALGEEKDPTLVVIVSILLRYLPATFLVSLLALEGGLAPKWIRQDNLILLPALFLWPFGMAGCMRRGICTTISKRAERDT